MTSHISPTPVRTRLAAGVMILAGAMAMVGCDPGFTYRPQHWQAVDGSEFMWSTSVGGVTWQTSGIFGLIGSKSISPEFQIHNEAGRTLVLERAELVTETARQAGEFPAGGAIDWRTVRTGGTERIPIYWDLSEHALDVLGAHPRIELEFMLDDQRERLTIIYEKVSDRR